jgi:uncharacterized protein (TIGR03032 family)
MSEATNDPSRVELVGSRMFAGWLASARASLAFTTYETGKLFLIGVNPDGRLSINTHSQPRCMGLGVGQGGRLWLSSLCHLWRLENFLEPGSVNDGRDALYVPVASHTTGDIDIHDVAEDGTGRPIFVVTRYNCLATVSAKASFVPLWRPSFIDRIAAEDRCHLNGLAMRDGRPAFVTCCASTNVVDGWRGHRRDGGVLLDVASGEAVATGLSMPHSPRFHRGRLWVLRSGAGEFGTVDLATGQFEPLCFLQGFARGVAFVGDHAVISVSRPRKEGAFDDLVLGERLARERVGPMCHLAVVNLTTGDIEHRLELRAGVSELYDVAAIPGVVSPVAARPEDLRFLVKPSPV